MMRPASFTGLPPELQVMIVSFLDQQDLRSCTLVSHDWHNFFNPILWDDIESYWDTDYTSSFLRSAAATGSLKKYGYHIRTLKFECMNEYFQEFLVLAPRKSPQLHSIELMGRVDSDDMIANLLWRCSRRHGGVGLRRVVFDLDGCEGDGDYFAFGEKSVRALMEHVLTLEMFCVETPWFSSKEIQRLLRSTPRLREFNILSKNRKAAIDLGGWLDASDIVRPEWACTSLRIFGCPIGGIPHPDIERELRDGSASEYVLEGNHRKSVALQKRVYSQLARLTHLRELRMGIPYDSEHLHYHRYDKESERQYDCLAMSLESGLDLLGSLKNLQVVALEDMEVGIDDEDERRWIAQHWPQAEVLTTDFGTDRDNDSQLSGLEDRDNHDEFERDSEEHYDDDDDEYGQGSFRPRYISRTSWWQ